MHANQREWEFREWNVEQWHEMARISQRWITLGYFRLLLITLDYHFGILKIGDRNFGNGMMGSGMRLWMISGDFP
jgi:hypothetical protein